MSQKRTTGQQTGVEANPVASDNIHGQTDSAGTGNQTPHVPISKDDGSMSTPRLTSALSSKGMSDGTLTLFSGPVSGRSSNQDTMESQDSRERRWGSTIKRPTPELAGVFGQGNDTRVLRSTDPYVTSQAPKFQKGQGSRASTEGKDD